jgi:rhodanese-related sulfurtransferase/SAM-dependent methyltransferase
VTERTGPPPPRRADVADSYNRGADTYEALWSPVILPPAAALVAFLRLTGRPVVADVGGGTGALLGAIGSAAPAARVVTLDASAAMLQAARVRRGASAILADALALPFAAGTVDAVILAYVLFHLADPPLALAEAARVLRPGGRAGIITWAWERESRARTLWDQILAGTGVPPAPPRRADAGLDRPDTVEALLRSAGLRPERIWCERLRRQWDHSSFWELATGGGANRVRLSLISARARAAVLDRAQTALSRLVPQDFLWEGEVICAVATKNRSGHPGGNGGTAKTVEELLAEARAMLPHRPSPAEAFEAQANGALLIDIRGDDQRRADGLIPGAVVVPRNVLEWRCDPVSPRRHAAIQSPDQAIVLFCHEGFQSSLAAAALQQLGLRNATDLDGGFTAWKKADLPVVPD